MGIRFGLFADLHSSLPGQPERGSSLRTAEDLKKALGRFRDAGCSFAVSLGDNTQPSSTAAEQFEQMRSLAESWNGYGFPVHLVPGNHEFQQLTPDEIRAITGRDRLYYDFRIGDVRFVVLDTAYRPDVLHYSRDNFDWRFSVVPEEETAWLKRLLADPIRTFVFAHCNLFFAPGEAEAAWYQVGNHREIRAILEGSGCVEAVFQGHEHVFRSLDTGGIRYVTVPSPERDPEYRESTFPVVEILDEGFSYNGERL